jgi:hypothetical protein
MCPERLKRSSSSGKSGHIIASLAERIDELPIQESVSDRKRLRILKNLQERSLLNISKWNSSFLVKAAGDHGSIDQDSKMISKTIAGSDLAKLWKRGIGPDELRVEMHIQTILDPETFLCPDIGHIGELGLKTILDYFTDESI